jgi:hypothetical protein
MTGLENEGFKDHRRHEVYFWVIIVLLCTQVLMITFLVSTAHAELPKQLWVLRVPDKIVKCDIATFTALQTLKVPRRVLEHPEYLSINAKGQMVFLPPKGMQWGNGEMVQTGDRMWFWDGHQAKEQNLESAKIRGGSTDKPTVTETALEWFLSAEAKFLFWLETRFEKIMDESGVERSVRSTSRVWRTDLAGDNPETITIFSTPEWCPCETGACNETCPEWNFWAPDGVVGDFFLVTSFTPGQLQSTYHESFLYQRSGRTWQAKKLPQAIESPLTASEKGEVLVARVLDCGCCGWDNDSSDQMLLLKNGKVSVLYDEFSRYSNCNYDVSFYTADARFADGNMMLAYTVVSTARNGSEIRLSSTGKENAEELARVSRAITDLPTVEVVHLGTEPKPTTIIRHATLVGWLSETEILVAQDGRLVVYDTNNNKRKETIIQVRSAADVFLR